jgi:hypothetical protein
VNDIQVHKIAWKKFTNAEIWIARKESHSFKAKSPRDDLAPWQARTIEDKCRPWLLVAFSAADKSYFLAFSRNSSDCYGNEESSEVLRDPPFEWRDHKHVGHNCKILDLCGKVNFGLNKKSGSPTYIELTGGTFKSSIQAPFCTQGSAELIAKVISSSRLVLRLSAQRLEANPYPSPFAMRPR